MQQPESFTKLAQTCWKGEQDTVSKQLLQVTRYGISVFIAFVHVVIDIMWLANPGYVVGL